jgi:hypothetical protein
MYPLNAILIGLDENLLPHVRRELMNCSCQLEAEYPDVPSAVVALRSSDGQKRVVVLHLGTPPDLDALSRLNVSLRGWPVLVLMDADDRSSAPAAKPSSASSGPVPLRSSRSRSRLATSRRSSTASPSSSSIPSRNRG